jgi:hypothetical protein
MLTLRPTDPVAIEEPLVSPNARDAADAADADGRLTGERLQQEEPSARRDSPDLLLDAPSIQSDIRVRSFALAFVGFLCAMFIGFVWEIRPLKLDSPEYGYDEALGTETSSLPGANFLTNCIDNCADHSLAIARASKDGVDRLAASAIVHAAASLTAGFTPTE